jgi:hypothetical protein
METTNNHLIINSWAGYLDNKAAYLPIVGPVYSSNKLFKKVLLDLFYFSKFKKIYHMIKIDDGLLKRENG